MKTDQEMVRWALEESSEPVIKNPYLRLAFRRHIPSTEAGTIPIEWDELSPQEQQYYQNPPFSTHPDFLGAKGGSAQLVQPGPGRLGLDKGGMAKVLSYLHNLEPGTELTMKDIMKVAGDNKWEVDVSKVYDAINNPNKKQIAASGNEVFVHGEERRNLLNKINQKIKLKQKFKQSPNENLFKQIDVMIADKKKYPDLKAIGEELGYKPTKKGKGGNLRLEGSLMEEWQKSRGRNLILEMRFKEYKLTKDSPWVKKVIELRKELGSTRATAKKLKVDRKTIRNITEQFAPNMFGKVNLRLSNKWNYKKVRAKREAELAKRLGGKDNPAFLQYMDLWEDIIDMNEDVLRMSDDAIWKNERIRQSMNLDVTGLKAGEGINFDRYKNLSKKDFAAKVREMADLNSFHKAEHSIPIASEKLSAGFPKNLQVASGKVGDQLEAIKLYIKNNPDGKHIPALNEFLEEFDIQIREGGKTYGWNNPKDKAGLNVYNTQSRTSDIVESAWTKNQTGKINNPNLRIIPKATKLPPSYGVGSTFAGVADDFLKTKTAKNIGRAVTKFGKKGARFLASDWVWPEIAIAGLEYKNRKQKGQSHERALSETLKLASLGFYDQEGTEKSIIKQAKMLGYEENDIQALDNFMKIHKLDEEIQKKIRLIDAMELGAVEQGDYGTAAEMERIQVGEEGGAQSLRAEVDEMKKMKESLIGFYYGALERAGDKEGNYGAEVYNKALQSLSNQEFNLSLEDRMKQADPYAGGIGSWLNTNVFTLDPKGQGELQQRIDAMNPEELREFNIQRGVMPIGPTYDAYDPRKMESLHDTMGYMYAGGGIAGLSGGKRFGPPPESGPMPQGGGLSSQFNRVKKLTG